MGVGVWYRCKGCGLPIGFIDARPPDIPKKACAHVKPIQLLGVPNSVPCALYQRLGADELWELHKDAERIESPESLTPVRE
jgi:hypothetical protein